MIRTKRGKLITSLALAAGLLVPGAGAAFAALTFPEGGVWEYGQNDDIVWSNYDHNHTCHGATAVGTRTDRDSALSGYWARAKAPSRWYAVDKSYYRAYC